MSNSPAKAVAERTRQAGCAAPLRRRRRRGAAPPAVARRLGVQLAANARRTPSEPLRQPRASTARGGPAAGQAGVAEELEQLPLEPSIAERAHAEEVVAAELELGLAAELVPLVVRVEHGQVVRLACGEAHLGGVGLVTARERREEGRARRERRGDREHVVDRPKMAPRRMSLPMWTSTGSRDRCRPSAVSSSPSAPPSMLGGVRASASRSMRSRMKRSTAAGRGCSSSAAHTAAAGRS